MTSPPPSPSNQPTGEPEYGGFTRFELELEFVQCLGNPWYLNYLAVQKYYDKPEFVAYLDYLQYFRQPGYCKFIVYPGPTLRALDLLQQKQFREDILKPEVVARLIEEGIKAGVKGPGEGGESDTKVKEEDGRMDTTA